MKKHVLYIDSDESVESLLEKVRLSLDFKNKIFIFIPEESPLFREVKTFEIFAEKIKEIGKKIVLVSESKDLFELANKHKISFQNTIDEDLQLFSANVKIKKIGSNTEKDELNFSYGNLKEKVKKIGIHSYLEEKKDKLGENYKMNKKLIFSFGVGSFALIFIILLLIIPSSKIYLEASSKPIEYIGNYYFQEKTETNLAETEDKNQIEIEKIEKLYEGSIVISPKGKSFEGEYSRGVLVLTNSYGDDLALRKGTRFQTEDGIIFRSEFYVNIPGAKKVKNSEGKTELKNGEARVSVIAEDLDVYQEIIGSRGNILKGTKLVIPGLSSYFQKLIFANVEENFSGGTMKWRSLVNEEDISTAKEKIKKELFEKAKREIEKRLNEENLERLEDFRLLPGEEHTKISFSKLQVPENLIGKKLDSFVVTGSVVMNAIKYNHKQLMESLEGEIAKKVHPKMEITFVDKNNVNIRIFEKDEEKNQIKATVKLEGRQEFDLFSESDFAKGFRLELQKKLTNTRKETAEKYLANQEEISGFKVQLWPPFLDKLPKIPESIKIIELEE